MDIKYKINEVLKIWNPIGIKGKDLDNEYLRYVDEIIECVNTKKNLLGLIEDIEGNRIGFFYTSKKDRELVVDQILKIFNED
ncbi:hypothetical protein [Algoriphagus marinus]|uniref:hypothetical protein n=1 Tax=Algoriphagus marinus TaxID=1925762 RepID=UPI00094B90B5|nr:hypothetical protein [Algoriphagus marinus]